MRLPLSVAVHLLEYTGMVFTALIQLIL